jgi:hypothetical protein
MQTKVWSRKGRCPHCKMSTGSHHHTDCPFAYTLPADSQRLKTKSLLSQQLEKLNTRFMASDPWRTIDNSLESLIDKVVLEMNPQLLDDQINEALEDWDNRETAIEILIDKLTKMKG